MEHIPFEFVIDVIVEPVGTSVPGIANSPVVTRTWISAPTLQRWPEIGIGIAVVARNAVDVLAYLPPTLVNIDIDDKQLRRAGLDYREFASIQEHQDLPECMQYLRQARLFARLRLT